MIEETFDIVDNDGNPTGEVITRTQAHAKGVCHRTAHVWIVRDNENGLADVLLQKRAANKDSFPGKYDTSSAGHILAGDEPVESAIRELSEELGIEAKPSDLTFIGTFPIKYDKEFHGKMFRDNEIAFVYIYSKDVNIDKLSLQKEEVESVEWFNIVDVCQACVPPRDDAFCVPTGGLDLVVEYLIENKMDIQDSFEIRPEIVTIAESSKKKMTMFPEVLSRVNDAYATLEKSVKECNESYQEVKAEKHSNIEWYIQYMNLEKQVLISHILFQQELTDCMEDLSRRLQEKTKKSEVIINQCQQEVSKYKSMLGIKQNPVPKIYPNDPCPCGSGLKYKKCCGKK